MVEFRSRYNIYVTSVVLKDRTVQIEFTSLRNGGSYYTTTDKEVSDALKKYNKHGCYVYREEKVKEAPVVEAQEEEETIETATIIDSVTNISEAKEYLRTLGVDHRKLSTPKSILAQAQIAGVVFPNLAQ